MSCFSSSPWLNSSGRRKLHYFWRWRHKGTALFTGGIGVDHAVYHGRVCFPLCVANIIIIFLPSYVGCWSWYHVLQPSLNCIPLLQQKALQGRLEITLFWKSVEPAANSIYPGQPSLLSKTRDYGLWLWYWWLVRQLLASGKWLTHPCSTMGHWMNVCTPRAFMCIGMFLKENVLHLSIPPRSQVWDLHLRWNLNPIPYRQNAYINGGLL